MAGHIPAQLHAVQSTIQNLNFLPSSSASSSSSFLRLAFLAAPAPDTDFDNTLAAPSGTFEPGPAPGKT
eukprot:CAMPEP_0184447610 /NCGR_PEP_ID=MMETSP0740-20130409/3805_1 /TAXON_ID=385413 /ORGANISM="Thalassiosira miniscula, Strain CCMP1093" /LENGTH=68 /DNA_ID=CAMNT_0026817293 /DNA_START=146 /DNA_END=352 /DNA_ORIENTATION=-